MKQQTTTLDIGELIASPTNPRTIFNDKDIQELALSIKTSSLEMPPVVRLLKNGKYEIVDGERRYRAAKLLQWKQIPCEVREMDDEQVKQFQLITFLQKVNLTPNEEAGVYHKFSKEGKKPEDISAITGRPISHIVRMLSLLKLIEPVKKAFDEGKLPLGHALELARLQPNEQKKAFTQAMESFSIDHQPISITDLKQFIDEQIHLDLRAAAFDKKDATLSKEAGACVTCSKRTGYNKDLFNDIAKTDVCSDPGCFKIKEAAHLQRIKDKLKAEGKEFVEVTKEYWKPAGYPDAITERSYKVVKGKPCSKAITGVIIDPGSKGTLITICNNKSCTQHYSKSERKHAEMAHPKKNKHVSPAQIEKERIEAVKKEMENRISELTENKILEMIPKFLPTTLKDKDILRIAEFIVEDFTACKFIEDLYKWKNVESQLKKLKPIQIIQVIHAGLLGIDYDNQYNDEALLEAKAKELSIDIGFCVSQAKAIAEKEFAEKLKPQQPIPEKETIHQTNKQDKPHSGGGVGQGPKKKKSKK
jgi:ParB family chromosome partitioning protein